MDGSMATTLVTADMQNLRALVVDPNEGLLFWTDWFEKNPRIERATMAGTERKTLFNIKSKIIGGGWPNGLSKFISLELWIHKKFQRPTLLSNVFIGSTQSPTVFIR
jgi:hypothetical protein